MGLLWNKSSKEAKYSKLENGVNKTAGEDGDAPYEALIAESQAEKESKKLFERLTLAAIIVSWMSVIFAFVSGVAAIVLGQMYDSQSLFGYGLDAVLDSLSSVAVLWRFHSGGNAAEAEAKERKACIIISFFFYVSAGSLLFKCITAMMEGEQDDDLSYGARLLTDLFAAFCGVVALGLATTKVIVGKRLNSQALMTDSIITFVGAAMSFLGVISLELYLYDNTVWYLDAVFGGSCGVFLLAFGLKLLIQMTCLYEKKEGLIEEEVEMDESST